MSTVRPTVHTNPSRKGALRKRISNRRNLKTFALRFSVDGKQQSFAKKMTSPLARVTWALGTRLDDHVISLPEFSQTQIQNGR